MTRQAAALLVSLVLAHAASAQFVQQSSKPEVRGARGLAAGAVAAVASGCGESWQVVTPPPTQNLLSPVGWTGAHSPHSRYCQHAWTWYL